MASSPSRTGPVAPPSARRSRRLFRHTGRRVPRGGRRHGRAHGFLFFWVFFSSVRAAAFRLLFSRRRRNPFAGASVAERPYWGRWVLRPRCPAVLRAFWLCDRGKQATCWLIAKKCFLSHRTAFAAAPLLLRGVGELWKLFHTSRSVIELRTARFWRPPCDEKEGPVGLVCN